ncbi:hypothetical protein ACTMTI_34085 [Nonomuraea sp. H19]|uniref:hypothetical protein n=1 Tax=Nonomuraea sp. H19 TaxID=3452206 RepID=UPI003F88DAF5
MLTHAPHARRTGHGRLVTAALLAGAAIAGLSLASAPAVAAACTPESPVCHGIIGTPGSYRLWFRFDPAPRSPRFTFTVNGAASTGRLTTRTSGTALEGEFRPSTVLRSGDRVCMRVVGTTQSYCATTP